MVVAAPVSSRAVSPAVPLEVLTASVLSADSPRVKVMACLARGDIAGAIAMYEVSTGRSAPAWLMDLQAAYGVASQTVGRCQEVARVIHTAFLKLDQSPQFIAFRANKAPAYMVFDLASGRNVPVAHSGYHVAVRMGDMVFDAYTGPMGMQLADYLSRLHVQQGFTWERVLTP